QNRIGAVEGIIPDIRRIAQDALSIGKSAEAIGKDARSTAGLARGEAKEAQRVADGALKNASRANDNATTAYNKAKEAQGIGEQAKGLAGQALQKGVEALGVALTALSLYQTVKTLRGLRGDPGIPGRQGNPGRDGRNGANGRDGLNGAPGITTVITLPGTPGRNGRDGLNGLPGRQGVPGRDGRDGINGLPGRNGRDSEVTPADMASLRALIIAQHGQTRGTSTANHFNTQAVVNGNTTTVVTANHLATQTVVNTNTTTLMGALTDLVTRIAQNTYLDKVLNLLTFAATMHNALMLSNNLGQTLAGIINTIIGLIFPKGINGETLDVSAIIGKTVTQIVEDSIGAENYAKLTTEWAKANRIYQATANVFNALQNAQNAILNATEIVGGQLAKVANALKKFGVIQEKAYEWFNPQPNFHNKVIVALEQATEAANIIDIVAQVPVSLVDAKTQLDSANEEFKASIRGDKNEDGTDKTAGLPTEENKPKKEEYDLGYTVSQGFEQIFEELFDAGE
ncbi:MAG: hypothetical protein RM021_008500, partial [Nostoc sp. EkiNYC01]|nr:hypothetical protein [Nostoc sp. EkiNYC01]